VVSFFLIGFSLPSHAVLLKEFVFTGVVNSVPDGVDGVEKDDTITGSFTYDLDTIPNSAASATVQSYTNAVVAFSVKVGDYDVSISNSRSNFVTITNNNPTGNLGLRDQFVIRAPVTGAGPVEAFDASIDMLAFTGTFQDLTLPDFLRAEAFYARSIRFRVDLGGFQLRTIFGEVTTLNQVSAPEPEAPSTPQVTGVGVGDQELVVSFSVADDGGSPITGLAVTVSDGNNSFTVTGSSSPIRVSGLTNGVSYTVSVTATNAIGSSAPSAVSAPITPAKFEDTALPIWLLYEATKPEEPPA
jgi:hypothetical protein